MKKRKLILLLGLVLIVLAGCFVGYSIFNKKDNNSEINDTEKEQTKEEKKVQIVDLDSNKRPIAVMINTHNEALPQSGLQDAYLVYELMVEGGITRMMALYTQDVDVAKIGSVRSSRHNYIDYVLENDAIYIHWGGSDVAYEDLKKINPDRIDGMVYGNKYFTTDKTLNRSLEHTRFTSTDLIKEGIAKLNFRTTFNDDNNNYLLNYTTDKVDLSNKPDSILAQNVEIKYSGYRTVNYVYNSEEGVYYRSMNGKEHKDLVTDKQYHFKNIIAYSVVYNSIEGTKLKDLQNIGSGEGVYITNGYSIPIKWSKETRSGKTKYTYMDGEEIDVSDGNTFIQIYPTTGNLTISA